TRRLSLQSTCHPRLLERPPSPALFPYTTLFRSRSTTLRTLSSSTGELVGEPFEVPGNEVHLLGHLEDGTPVASARDGDRLRYLTFEDGAWILSGTTTPFGGPFDWPRPTPVVVDGRVRDVRALLGSTHPRDVELPVIEL